MTTGPCAGTTASRSTEAATIASACEGGRPSTEPCRIAPCARARRRVGKADVAARLRGVPAQEGGECLALDGDRRDQLVGPAPGRVAAEFAAHDGAGGADVQGLARPGARGVRPGIELNCPIAHGDIELTVAHADHVARPHVAHVARVRMHDERNLRTRRRGDQDAARVEPQVSRIRERDARACVDAQREVRRVAQQRARTGGRDERCAAPQRRAGGERLARLGDNALGALERCDLRRWRLPPQEARERGHRHRRGRQPPRGLRCRPALRRRQRSSPLGVDGLEHARTRRRVGCAARNAAHQLRKARLVGLAPFLPVSHGRSSCQSCPRASSAARSATRARASADCAASKVEPSSSAIRCTLHSSRYFHSRISP